MKHGRRETAREYRVRMTRHRQRWRRVGRLVQRHGAAWVLERAMQGWAEREKRERRALLDVQTSEYDL